MWTYDLAREQSPTLEHLHRICQLTLDSGYDALGLYLEHRFAYPSAPWAAGRDALTPEMVGALRKAFPTLQIVPFINLLGHFEGFIYSEGGQKYREGLFKGMQACPSNPDFVSFCENLIDDTLAAFDSPIIHIGGDETQQLNEDAACRARSGEWLTQNPAGDPKAWLFGEHFGALARRVIDAGRRPAIWADMLAAHHEAIEYLPKETLLFDWQYFSGLGESATRLSERGFEIVGCPSIQTYNATWCHLKESGENIRQVHADVVRFRYYGTCVTTWELALMGAYDSIFPAIRAAGGILNGEDITLFDGYESESLAHLEWAKKMSDGLAEFGGTFTPGQIRSSLKVRLLLNRNPFLCWLHHSEEFCQPGHAEKLIAFASELLERTPEEAYKSPAILLRSAVEFVVMAQSARLSYAEGQLETAISKLAHARSIFDDLHKYAKWTHERIGGSLADLARCQEAKKHIEAVIVRIRQYGSGRELGYRPSFEAITHPKFMPHDQACWWLINSWANE